jgi:hypothetical protein
VKQGVPVRVLLATATGFGAFVSVVVLVSPNSYQAELEDFFKNLNFKANQGGQSPPGSSAAAGPAVAGDLAPKVDLAGNGAGSLCCRCGRRRDHWPTTRLASFAKSSEPTR